jgi:predicted DNA-binding transcriptional regulator AlpA
MVSLSLEDRHHSKSSRIGGDAAKVICQVDTQFIDTKAAAKMLGMTHHQLELMRHQGKGPKPYKFSKRCVRYRVDEILAWAESFARESEAV